MLKKHRQGVEHSKNVRSFLSYNLKNISLSVLRLCKKVDKPVANDLVKEILWKRNIKHCYGKNVTLLHFYHFSTYTLNLQGLTYRNCSLDILHTKNDTNKLGKRRIHAKNRLISNEWIIALSLRNLKDYLN